jgi:hypothetical protein
LAGAIADGLALFVDESHVDRRSAARTHGRAPPGQSVVVEAPANGGTQRERHTLVRGVGTIPVGSPNSVHRTTSRRLVSVNAVVTSGSNDATTFVHFVNKMLGPAAHALRQAFAARHSCTRLAVPPPSIDRPVRRHGVRSVWQRPRDGDRPDHRDGDNSRGDHLDVTVPSDTALPISLLPRGQRREQPARRVRTFSHGVPLRRQGDDVDLSPTELSSSVPPVAVVMDNWRGHHARVVREAFDAWRDTLRPVFVPPYSPDLNAPIECSFHDIKSALRRTAHATGCLNVDVLQRVVDTCDGAAESAAFTLLRRARRAGYMTGDAWIDSELDRVGVVGRRSVTR